MSLADLTQRFHAHRCLDPNACVELGVDERLAELPDPSLNWIESHAREANALREAFLRLSTERLCFEEQLDVDLAQLMLEAESFDAEYEFNGRTTAAQQPQAGDQIGNGIFLLSVADPRAAADRLSDITGRIEAVPRFLSQMLSRLDTPVTRWVNMDIEKVEALPTLLESMNAWAEQEGFGDAERLRAAVAGAKAALTDYTRGLSCLPTTDRFHVGAETAARIVRLRGIDQSLGELHAMARRFLADTNRELEELRTRLCAKYCLDSQTGFASLQAHLNQRFRVELTKPGFEEVLDRYRSEHERLLRFIDERQLFPIPEGQELRIMATPGFMQPSIPAGAMTPPAPFRKGTATSLIFLTLSEELLDEHTELGIPVMMIHEGIPGHHLQLASASKHPSVIRRHVMANDHAEGWTTLLEDYMLDRGYLTELVDETRFCAKRELCRIGARVAIDLFFMTGDQGYLDVGINVEPSSGGSSSEDPFVAAGKLLTAVTGFTSARCEAELNWYSQERAYPLSYLTGNRLVAGLREDLSRARPEWASDHRDRVFFQHYLSAGNMPLSFTRRYLRAVGLLPA